LLRKRFRTLMGIFKDAGLGWVDDDVPAMAAAIAYHATLSLAPLLIVLLGTISLIFGGDAVETEVVGQIETAVGLLRKAKAAEERGLEGMVAALAAWPE